MTSELTASMSVQELIGGIKITFSNDALRTKTLELVLIWNQFLMPNPTAVSSKVLGNVCK